MKAFERIFRIQKAAIDFSLMIEYNTKIGTSEHNKITKSANTSESMK